MKTIILTSKILTIIEIKKETKAYMFKDLNIGDSIQLSIPVKKAGSNRSTYASYIKIENVRTGGFTHKSFNEIEKILNNFEFI